jgi:hypothetical protein
MSRDDAHPALHSPGVPHQQLATGGPGHYVPEGWEDLNRGICPCGEVVFWSEGLDQWLPARAFRVLVLTPDEITALRRSQMPTLLKEQIEQQLDLQDEVEGYTKEANDGK